LPGALAGGGMQPRLPGLVFALASAGCSREPNSLGVPGVPWRSGRACGSNASRAER